MAPSFHCPHCDEPVAAGAAACPHCGSDAVTGWNPAADSETFVDTPEMDDDEYQEFLTREFPEEAPASRTPSVASWKVVALVLVVAFTLWALRLL